MGCSITLAESKMMESWIMDSGWSRNWIALQLSLKILEFDVENYLFWGLWVTIHLIEYIFLRILAQCGRAKRIGHNELFIKGAQHLLSHPKMYNDDMNLISLKNSIFLMYWKCLFKTYNIVAKIQIEDIFHIP